MDSVAAAREIKFFALVQPHFETISPILVNSMLTSPATFTAAIKCFQQPRETVLHLTREFTLPKLVLEDQLNIIQQIAEASNMGVPSMLADVPAASAILAYLFMKSEDERKKGLKVFMRELKKADMDPPLTLPRVLISAKIPLAYLLAFNLGDESLETRLQVRWIRFALFVSPSNFVDNLSFTSVSLHLLSIDTQAERAFQSIERLVETDHSSKVDLGNVLKSSIVGILSLMNRGLNESTAHRPLRYKQQIIRSLEFVTERVGPAIAGYSPQVRNNPSLSLLR